jgi:hypothetical protein
MVRSSHGQPTLYSIRRPRRPCFRAVFNVVRWAITSWEAPAPSMVTRTSVLHAAGICSMAASRTSRWSAAVNEPAFARAQHHREVVPDVRAPGGQRMEPETALVL